MSIKIVGIDASLASTGMCQMGNILETVTTSIQSKLTGPQRLIEIRRKMWDFVRGSELVVLEDYSFASGNQAHQIGELGGILRVTFFENGLRVLKVSPSQLKKFITGKGNAKKEEIAVAIFKKWGREFKTNDEADAFVLARIGMAYMGHTNGLTAYQQEVIDALHGKSEVKKKKIKGGK